MGGYLVEMQQSRIGFCNVVNVLDEGIEVLQIRAENFFDACPVLFVVRILHRYIQWI